jgi:hypothetical protein
VAGLSDLVAWLRIGPDVLVAECGVELLLMVNGSWDSWRYFRIVYVLKCFLFKNILK